MNPRRICDLLIVLALLVSTLGWTAAPGSAGFQPDEPDALAPLTSAHSPGGLTAQADPALKLDAIIANQPFAVQFSAPMDPVSAAAPLVTYPYLPGRLAWNAEHTRLTFSPDKGFQPGKMYHIYLDSGLKSADGNSFSRIQQWQIQVKTAPRLTSYSPASAELANRLPVIKLVFNQTMNTASVEKALVVQPPIKYGLRWSETTAEVTLQSPVDPGAHLRFSLARQAMDADGVPLDREYAWDYWIAPLKAQAVANTERELNLTFNYEIAAGTGPQFAFDPPLKGKWSWTSPVNAHFVAENKATPSAQAYTIKVIAPLSDPKGNLFPAIDPIPFTPQSPVWQVNPTSQNAEDSVGVGSPVFISFRTPMDHASTEAAFKMDPAAKGKFTWDANSITFTPDQPLTPNTKYTVILGTSARDANGSPALIAPYAWSFYTQPAWQVNELAPVSFGEYGPNAQVVDAGSRRALQLTADNGIQILFSLYKIKPEDFVRIFKSHFMNRYYWDGKAVFLSAEELAGMEKVTEWPQKSTGGLQETLIPTEAPAGAYVLAARAGGALVNEMFVILTHNTLVVKKSDDRLWVWATKINGENVPGLYVRLYMQDGSIMREGKTDEAGVFATSLPKDVAPYMVTAGGEGDDITVSGIDSSWGGYNPYGDCCGWSSDPAKPTFGAYLFTDRPIYRPGQTVNFKGLFRADDDTRYTLLPEGTQVKVSMHDSRDNVVQTVDLPLNAFGTLNGAFLLADGAMLGDYTVQAELGKKVYEQVFKVQEYHKPDYQVRLNMDKAFYADGETGKMNIDVRYFFDQPVADANLTVNFYHLAPQYYSSYWWEDIQVGAELPEGAAYDWLPMSDSGAHLTTDKDGKQTYEFLAKADFSSGDYYTPYCRTSWRSTLRECLFGLEVTADDGSNQPVSASKIIKVYAAPDYFTVDSGNWVKKVGETFNVTAQVTALDGKPVSGRKLSISVKGWSEWSYSRSVSKATLTSGEDGKVALPVKVEEEGCYRIQVTNWGDEDSDYAGISDWVYVTSTKPAWSQESWGEFKIAAERTQYKPYETARLMITSSFDGPALLTFERGHVIHTQPVMLTAPLTLVDTQIIPEDAPNVFVKVNAWKAESTKLELPTERYWSATSLTNSRLYTSSVELQVDASDKQLNIEITPEQPYYAPRQEASFAIKVTGASGQPVQAELSAALVDEAIFSLSEDLSGRIFNAFYGPRPLTVSTFNSMALVRYFEVGGRGGGGGGGSLVPASPRSNFPDTAAWIPAVKTDVNGQAKITITLPDSLTTWRLTVKAITLGTRVGEATASIITRQEITLQPALPAGLTAGDMVDLPVLVRNDGIQARDVRLAFKGQGLELAVDAAQTVNLRPAESRIVAWRVTARKPGSALVTVTAEAEGAGDAVELPLEIRQRTLPDVASEAGDFTGEVTTVVVLPETALPGSSADLRVSRSIASDMLGGLDFLTGYPYGCVEQTMSRALPNAVVGRALHGLGLDNPGLEQKLPELINAGLQRLYGYQHDDGGWGWWFDDATDPYQTAWVIFGLSTTAKAGYAVDPQVIKRGAEYLQKAIKDQENAMDPRLKAYSLYALAYAGYGDRETAAAMVESAYSLDAFSQAALALALQEQGESDRARIVLNILDSSTVVDADKAYWMTGVEDGHYHTKTMSSGLRSTALALTAYLKIDPASERIAPIVRYLLSQRRSDGWGSTNETAYTILALTDYLLANQQAEGEAGYIVLLNGQTLSSGTIQPGEKPVSLALPVDQMKKGPNVLKIQHAGEGRLYYALASRLYLDVPQVEAAGVITVQRTYLDAQTNQPIQSVKAGQLVRVELRVTIPGGYASYLMVEDHLPAGLEALNENLNITAHDSLKYRYNSEEGYLDPYYFWQEYGYNNKEIRGAQVNFFVTEYNSSRANDTFNYLARAAFTGTFSALPAEATAMYDAALWGRSGSNTITIQPK